MAAEGRDPEPKGAIATPPGQRGLSPDTETSTSLSAPHRDGPGGLLQLIRSPQLSVFHCVTLLVDHADNVGVHYTVCQRLREYARADVESYLPQLVQIFVTIETESAALEELLMEMCTTNTHVMLMMFWHLQASLHDLAPEPQSHGFIVAKRLYNKIQFELFAFGQAPSESLRENTQPALILASAVAASLVPGMGSVVKPLVISQGRRQRSYLLRIANKLRGGMSSSSRETSQEAQDDDDLQVAKDRAASFAIHEAGVQSMPNLSAASGSRRGRKQSIPGSYDEAARRMSGDTNKRTATKQLKMNYFRTETQFVYSLESIASRLVSVPKAARLSALKVELAMLNNDLPAEVDIPGLLPWHSTGKQDRIVRISPNEATVLNSAEKAPFLLLIEFLRGGLDFDPDTERNKHILATQNERKYLFDRSFHPTTLISRSSTPLPDANLPDGEKDMADFSLSDLERLDKESVAAPSGYAESASAAGAGVSSQDADAPLSHQEAQAAAAAASEAARENTNTDIASLATQMRTASVILAQLDGLERSKLPKADVTAIKAKIISNMQSMQGLDVLAQGEAGDRKLENDLKTAGLSLSDDPSAANLGEDWNARRARIRKASKYGQHPNWELFSVIVKTGDDLRQEALASQLIQLAYKYWKEEQLDVWVKKVGILITGANSGLVETITNGLSIHSIKKALTAANAAHQAALTAKATENSTTPAATAAEKSTAPVAQLSQHFEAKFGPRASMRHQRALEDFVSSLAPYSLLCYLLQVRDRHNGNILLDSDGHIIHIDFGFMLSNTPGGRFGLESAPFKLTQEYVDLIGGPDSDLYKKFLALLKQSFKVLRKHADEFVRFVEIASKDSHLPCFQGGATTAAQLRQRFQLQMSDTEIDQYVENYLVFKSYGSYSTRLYDQFQMVTQGIYS